MSECAITRRNFLAGSAGAAALVAGSGSVGLIMQDTAHAEEAEGHKETTAHSLCGACPAQCGFTAYVVDGTLSKVIGDEGNPHAKGKLCARGYAFTQSAYAEERLTDPLKKNESDEFEAISWEQAYSEIAEKLNAVIETHGADSIAVVQDGGSSTAYYAKRFINAIGSGNYFSHNSLRDGSRKTATSLVIGAQEYQSDIAQSNMTLILGFNQAEAFRPSTIASLKKAYESGSQIIVVDPQYSSAFTLADEWLPINPGSELALILAIARVLVSEELYDAQFVADNTVGFSEWAAAIASYTPEWAAEKTGISAPEIARIARSLAKAAPAASVEINLGNSASAAYANSGETARAACLLNTLLGSWNKKGGALVASGLSLAASDDDETTARSLGATEYPFASEGASAYLARAAKDGTVKGVLFCDSDLVAETPDQAFSYEAFSQLDFKVAIATTLTETAALAEYVLPDTSYLEQFGLPVIQGVANPSVAIQDQAIAKVHENTKSIDQIITELAQACGVGGHFSSGIEELAETQLSAFGLGLAEVRRLGTVAIPEAFRSDSQLAWTTPSGKIQFSSEQMNSAGLSPIPVWVEPKVQPVGNMLRLISGEQPIHFATKTSAVEGLSDISKDQGLMSALINARKAGELGLADGDEIEIEGQGRVGRIKVRVTECINPSALYVPRHYRLSAGGQTPDDDAVRYADFVPLQFEEGYGSPMTQEALVLVRKVGA